MIKRIIAFLLIAAAFCTAHANSASDIRPSFFQKDSVYAEQYAALTQVDFDNYYKNLIQAENDAINKASIGFFIGIFSTGFGVMTIATAFNSGGGSDWVEMNRHILKFTGIGLTSQELPEFHTGCTHISLAPAKTANGPHTSEPTRFTSAGAPN